MSSARSLNNKGMKLQMNKMRQKRQKNNRPFNQVKLEKEMDHNRMDHTTVRMNDKKKSNPNRLNRPNRMEPNPFQMIMINRLVMSKMIKMSPKIRRLLKKKSRTGKPQNNSPNNRKNKAPDKSRRSRHPHKMRTHHKPNRKMKKITNPLKSHNSPNKTTPTSKHNPQNEVNLIIISVKVIVYHPLSI